MASVYGKVTASGTKLHYIKFKDLDGKWKGQNSHCATRKDAQRLAMEGEARVARGEPFFVKVAPAADTFAVLAEQFIATLTNRSKANDASRVRRHLIPMFGALPIASIDLALVMSWIDQMRAQKSPRIVEPKKGRGRRGNKELSESTMRALLNLLSRFFSWAVVRGLATSNPVKSIPTASRPQEKPKAEDRPWIADDKVVSQLMKALAPPWRLMFYLGNRSGLRRGEIMGLRIGDMAFLAKGAIRASHSYDGCLKEDKRQIGMSKWVPAADDAQRVLGAWLKARTDAKAKDDDYLFPRKGSWGAMKQQLADAWAEATEAVGIKIGFYEATRHSFTSRGLSEGVSLDEVANALGHSSPAVTRRFYDHFVQKDFSIGIRRGITEETTAETTEEE